MGRACRHDRMQRHVVRDAFVWLYVVSLVFTAIFLHAVAPKYNLLHAPGARPRRYDAALVLRSTL